MPYDKPETCCNGNCQSKNIHNSMKDIILIENNTLKELQGDRNIYGSGIRVNVYHCEDCGYVMLFRV